MNPSDLISIPRSTGKATIEMLEYAVKSLIEEMSAYDSESSEYGGLHSDWELCHLLISEIKEVVDSKCKCEGEKRLSCQDASCQYWHYLDCDACNPEPPLQPSEMDIKQKPSRSQLKRVAELLRGTDQKSLERE